MVGSGLELATVRVGGGCALRGDGEVTLDRFLEDQGWAYAEQAYRAATVASYRSVYRRHLRPLLGGSTLRDLGLVEARSVAGSVASAGGGPATARTAVALFRSMRVWAQAVGVLEPERPSVVVGVRQAVALLARRSSVSYRRYEEGWGAGWWWSAPAVPGCDCRHCERSALGQASLLGRDELDALGELERYCRRHRVDREIAALVGEAREREISSGRRAYPRSEQRSVQHEAGRLGRVLAKQSAPDALHPAAGWYWRPRYAEARCRCRHCAGLRRGEDVWLEREVWDAVAVLRLYRRRHAWAFVREAAGGAGRVRRLPRSARRPRIKYANHEDWNLLSFDAGAWGPHAPVEPRRIPEPRPAVAAPACPPGLYWRPPPARAGCGCRYCAAVRAGREILLGDEGEVGLEVALAAFDHYETVHLPAGRRAETAQARLQQIVGDSGFVFPYRGHRHWDGWSWYPPPARVGCWCVDCVNADQARPTYLGATERQAERHLREYRAVHRLALNAFWLKDFGTPAPFTAA